MGNWDGESGSGLSHKPFSGVIHSQAKQSKAFTGTGTRLGGGDDGSTQELVSDPLRDPVVCCLEYSHSNVKLHGMKSFKI